MYQVKSNRTTNHIEGIGARSTGTGEERDGTVTYYATSACPAITRTGHRMWAPKHAQFETLADALASARTGTRKICKTCEKAAEAALAAEQARPTGPKPVKITPTRRALLQEVADGRVYKYPSGRCSYVAVPGEKTKTVTAAMNFLTDAGLATPVRDSRLSDVWDYQLTDAGRDALAPTEQPSTPTEAEMLADALNIPVFEAEARLAAAADEIAATRHLGVPTDTWRITTLAGTLLTYVDAATSEEAKTAAKAAGICGDHLARRLREGELCLADTHRLSQAAAKAAARKTLADDWARLQAAGARSQAAQEAQHAAEEAATVVHIDHTAPMTAIATLTTPRETVTSRQARLGAHHRTTWYACDDYTDNPGTPTYVTARSALAAARKWVKALGFDPYKVTITEDREY